jgi:hypothetical protein
MQADDGKPICHACRVVSGRTLMSDRIEDAATPIIKTDEERKAELMKPVTEAVKCSKCKIRTAMTSMSHGLCASCAFESI